MILKNFKASLLRTTAVVSTAFICLTTANASQSAEIPSSASAAAPMAALPGAPDPNANLRAQIRKGARYDVPDVLINVIADYALDATPVQVAENVEKLKKDPKGGQGMDLNGANLTRAILDDAILAEANLTGANLTDVVLPGANLTGANLTGANLGRANLYDANLSGANLSGAILAKAFLDWANLTGANLTGANLQMANLHGAYVIVEGKQISGKELKTYFKNNFNLEPDCAIFT